MPPPRTVGEAVTRIHAGVVQMFDQGDGHGVDWDYCALVLFAASTAMAAKQPHAAGMQQVLRHAEAEVYNLLHGNEPDSLAPPIAPSAAPGVDNTSMRPARAPQQRLKP